MDLEGIEHSADPALLRQESRDFYWYLPVLKRQLDGKTAQLWDRLRNEAEGLRVLAQTRAARMPLTARGGVTGMSGAPKGVTDHRVAGRAKPFRQGVGEEDERAVYPIFWTAPSFTQRKGRGFAAPPFPLLPNQREVASSSRHRLVAPLPPPSQAARPPSSMAAKANQAESEAAFAVASAACRARCSASWATRWASAS